MLTRSPRLLRCLILLPLLLFGSARAAEEPQAVRVHPASAAAARALEQAGFDVAYHGMGRIEVLTRAADRARLSDLGYTWESLDRDLFPGARSEGREGNLDFQYHTYQEMLAELASLEESYPQICRLYDLGDALSKNYTWDNYDRHYDIWGLRISDNPGSDEPEPCIVYDGRHHAREPVSTEITLAVARYFCENYAADPQIRDIVNSAEIWCVPMVNPDGHQWVEDNDPWWRKTLHDHDQDHHVDEYEGIDPNRNYDWHWTSGTWSSETYGGPLPWSAPEVASMRDLHLLHRPAINASYHTYGNEVLYPFGYGVLAEPAVLQLATQYANLIGYLPRESTTPGGSSKDWVYGTVGSAAFTVEMGDEFIPPGTTMEQIVQQVLPGSIWLAQRLWGPSIQGQVVDAETALPLEATIHIPEIQDYWGDGELQDMRTEASTGYYCRVRPQPVESITLEVSAEGYSPQSIQVTTGGTGATVRDIELAPLVSGLAGRPGAGRGLSLQFNNPYRVSSPIRVRSAAPEAGNRTEETADLAVYDLSGALVRRLFTGVLPPGRTELSWDGLGERGERMPPGLYFLHCRRGDRTASSKLLLLD